MKEVVLGCIDRQSWSFNPPGDGLPHFWANEVK